jgi:hypothetical protein
MRNIKADYRADETYNQGLEDAERSREYQQSRRERQQVLDERNDDSYVRADVNYGRQEKTYQRAEMGRKVRSAFMISGDISGIMPLYNSIDDGNQITNIEKPKTKNGKYLITFQINGQDKTAPMSRDEIGMALTGITNPNEITRMEAEQAKAVRAQEDKLAQIGLQNTGSLAVANVRAGGETGASKAQAQQNKISKERVDYHTKRGDITQTALDTMGFQYVSKADASSRIGVLGVAYEIARNGDRAGASRDAQRDLLVYAKQAEKIVNEEFEEGVEIGVIPEDEWKEERVRLVLESIVDERLNQLQQTGTTNTKSETQPKKLTQEQYYEKAKKLGWPDDIIQQKMQEDIKANKVETKANNAPIETPAPENAVAQGGLEHGQTGIDPAKDTLDKALDTTVVAMADDTEISEPEKPDQGLSGGYSSGITKSKSKLDAIKADIQDLLPEEPDFGGGISQIRKRQVHGNKVRGAARQVKQRLNSRTGNLKGLSPETVRLALLDSSLVRKLTKKKIAIIRKYLNSEKITIASNN